MSDQVLGIRGLYTSANQLSDVPEGALQTARNIDIISQGLAQPRRGFKLANDTAYTATTDRTDQLFFYQDKMFSHHGTYLSAGTLSYYNSGWNSVGSYSAPSDTRMRFLEANQNLYFTSSTGFHKLDAFDGTAKPAGVAKALNMELALTGSSGWFEGDNTDDQVVAYRCVWSIKDANDNLVIGAPSGRALLSNTLATGTNRNVTVTVYIPDTVTTSHFVQIYRSTVVASPSATPVEPNDELQLVYEAFPSAGEITAGELSITDITSEGLRGAALYTNATQQGLAAGNEKPPLAKDITSFRESTFFANTTSQQRYYLTLLAASSMANDDTITIDSIVYTAKASETTASGYFKLFTAGSASQNIADTARSLVNVINQYSSSTVYGYYLSSGSDLPGKMLLEERGIGAGEFAVNASDDSYWSPSGIPTSGSTETSSGDEFQNQLIWSKANEPEHVPLTNTSRVGSANYEILRIVPLKDALIIFKQDGIFRLTGYYGGFNIDKLDSSAKLIGTETPVVLNNEIYCLTDLGVVKVSDSVQIISVDINQDLIQVINRQGENLPTFAFSQAYETDKKFYLWVPKNTSDTNPTSAFVYNVLTQAWTTHELEATASVVYDKTIYYGKGSSNLVMKERKNYSYLDYADYGFETTISSISSLTLTLGSGTDNITAGDIIEQSSSIWATVQSVNSITSTVVVDRDPGLSAAACTVLTSIPTEIEWVSFTSPSPGVLKQYHTGLLFFQEAFNGTATMEFQTDLSPGKTAVTLTGIENGNWAVSVWGGTVWGSAPFARSWRSWLPRSKQRCSSMDVTFKHSWAYSPWKLTGASVLAKQGSSRVRRD